MGLKGKVLLHKTAEVCKFKVDKARCPSRDCGWFDWCINSCFGGYMFLDNDGKPEIPWERCNGCASCFSICHHLGHGAIFSPAGSEDWCVTSQIRMAEAALAVLKTKRRGKCGFINVAYDVVPLCDCEAWSDTPLVQNIGLIFGRDIVAVDEATMDLIDKAVGLPDSASEEKKVLSAGSKKFAVIHDISPRIQVEHGEKIGLGTRSYKLIKIETTAGDWPMWSLPEAIELARRSVFLGGKKWLTFKDGKILETFEK